MLKNYKYSKLVNVLVKIVNFQMVTSYQELAWGGGGKNTHTVATGIESETRSITRVYWS